jgi:hypothetical protein
MGEHQVLKREKEWNKKESGGEAVKNYPPTCVFVEGTEAKA